MTPSEFNHLSALLVGTDWGSQSRLATLLGVSSRMIRYWKSGDPKRSIPLWVEAKLISERNRRLEAAYVAFNNRGTHHVV